MTPEFPYVQLPGTYRGFFRKASLWEGADHILSVSGTRFNEEYRRFYYRDIQALIIEERANAGSLGWWIILVGLLFVSILATVEKDPPYSWIGLLVLSVLLIIRLDITFLRSCRCSIQTAVSRERLPSLIRRAPAKAAIARLQGRIASVQGDLPNEIPQSEDELAATLRAVDPGASSASDTLEEAVVRGRRRLAVRGVNMAIAALFILLLNAGYTFWLSDGGRHTPTVSAFASYSFIAVGLLPVCLSLQYIAGLRALSGLRILLVGMIVLSGFRVVIGVASISLQSAVFRTQGVNAFFLFQRHYANINGAVQFALAAGGLLLIFAKWETYRRGEISSS
jgi:hypothetical protein